MTDYSDVKLVINWLRAYADMLESGQAELKHNALEVSIETTDMTTCDDRGRTYIPGDAHHRLVIEVRVQSRNEHPTEYRPFERRNRETNGGS
jgi:hypothetical protein